MDSLARPLGFLLEPLVVIDWPGVEKGLTDLLRKKEFAGEDPDFTKEFDLLESKVPPGPDGRGNINFTRVIINAVMAFAVGGNFFFSKI